MKVKLYRATRNITPDQAQEVYISDEPSYLFGKGMYFAYDKEMCRGLAYMKDESSWSLICTYQVEAQKVLNIENGKFVVEPDSNLGKLQIMANGLTQKLHELEGKKGLKTVFEVNPKYGSLSKEEQDKILNEVMSFNEEVSKLEESKEISKQMEEVSKLIKKVELAYENEFKTYDVLVSETMVVIKNPELNIDLIEFDLFASEEKIKQLSNLVKIENSGSCIEHIPVEYSSSISKFLKNN